MVEVQFMFFSKIKDNLFKTKEAIDSKLNNIFGKNKEINEIIDEIEEVLILSDLGVNTSVKVCNKLREEIKKQKDKTEDNIKTILKKELQYILDKYEKTDETNNKRVILIVGVNGVR